MTESDTRTSKVVIYLRLDLGSGLKQSFSATC
jgi:hypothetical protein